MGRTASNAPGYAPDDGEFDPLLDDFESRERSYKHFDLPLDEGRRKAIRATPRAIIENSFWPLLAFSKIERRAKREKGGEITFSEKVREIKFGSHLDAALYQHYALQLAALYEGVLHELELKGEVLAYRSGIGNNIRHARDLFGEIKRRGECIAIGIDISGFFDNIRHTVLLDNLKGVLKEDRLSAHHFAMFKRMTRFEWVDADQLAERLHGIRPPHGRLCSAYQFRRYVRTKENGLVKVNCKHFGIPQGTPLSGLYANISLMRFDERMRDYFNAVGGSYRRYSDDIAVLVPGEVGSNQSIAELRTELARIGLEISERKTDISRFHSSSGETRADKPFQYLGFTFDGQKTLIRQSSLNRFYAKMRSGIHAKVMAARAKGVPLEQMYMRELFRKYTHFGKSSNFPRYVYRASDIFGSLDMRKQIANHFEIFKSMVRMEVARGR